MIELTRFTVPIPYLPPAMNGTRIAHLTDIHRGHLTDDRHIEAAIEAAQATAPHLVALTGDFVVHAHQDIGPVARMLSRLKAPLGVVAILGNHDYLAGGRRMVEALTEQGVQMLINKHIRVGDGLVVGGVDDDHRGRPDFEMALRGVEPNEPLLMLIHNPAEAEKLQGRGCVVLSGHTHGGQIRVPFLTSRQVRRIGAKHYQSGWYRHGETRIYVNRGVGQVGLPVRFLCRPEVALMTLVCGTGAPQSEK